MLVYPSDEVEQKTHLEEAKGGMAGSSLLHVSKGPSEQEAQLGIAGLVGL